MRPSIRSLTVLAGLLLLSAGTVGEAVAQFRPKLPSVNLPGKKSSGSTKAPTYNDRVLEITDARIDQVIKGYHVEAAEMDAYDTRYAEQRRVYEEELKGHPAKLKAYQQQKKTWDACQDREVKPANAKQQAKVQKAQDEVTGGDTAAFNKRMEDVQARIKKAQADGDMTEVMRLADSIGKAGMKTAQAATEASAEMQKAASKCGVEPTEPQPPTSPMESAPETGSAGANAAGLTASQYAILKERIQYAVDEKGEVDPKPSSYAFSSNEIAALKKRGAELAKAYTALTERH